MMFDNRNYKKPVNAGESRISLNILETCEYARGLCRLLDTNEFSGIVGDKIDLQRRSKVFGKHFIAKPTIESFWWVKLPRQFEEDSTIMLIWVTTLFLVLSIFTNATTAYIESLMIFFGVFFAAFVQALCEYLKDRQWLQMASEVDNQEITVYRGNGEARTCKVRDLVVGDIVKIVAGNKVPADCVLIEEQSIIVDQCIYYKRDKAVNKSLSIKYDEP